MHLRHYNPETPSCDLKENDFEYIFRFQIPGMMKEDLQLEVRENQLVILGLDRPRYDHREGLPRWVSLKRSAEIFERSFLLPPNVEIEDITAAYEDGILSVAMPKIR